MSVIFDHVSRHICKIVLNRPSKRNAINQQLYKQLRDALDRFDEDDSLKVAIVGGADGNFCAGYDLNSIVDPTTRKANMPAIEELLWPLGHRLSKKKITIAAIEGHAVGVGYELALKCDFRIAERDARMGFLNRRFGVPIMNGGTVILPHLVGLARASEMIATGKAQLAPEALQFGGLTYIADIGCCFGRATNLARCLVKFEHEAIMHDLRSLYSSMEHEEIMIALQNERDRSLEFLGNCGPLDMIFEFIEGRLCRHGNTDLGNISTLETDVTL